MWGCESAKFDQMASLLGLHPFISVQVCPSVDRHSGPFTDRHREIPTLPLRRRSFSAFATWTVRGAVARIDLHQPPCIRGSPPLPAAFTNPSITCSLKALACLAAAPGHIASSLQPTTPPAEPIQPAFVPTSAAGGETGPVPGACSGSLCAININPEGGGLPKVMNMWHNKYCTGIHRGVTPLTPA